LTFGKPFPLLLLCSLVEAFHPHCPSLLPSTDGKRVGWRGTMNKMGYGGGVEGG